MHAAVAPCVELAEVAQQVQSRPAMSWPAMS